MIRTWQEMHDHPSAHVAEYAAEWATRMQALKVSWLRDGALKNRAEMLPHIADPARAELARRARMEAET